MIHDDKKKGEENVIDGTHIVNVIDHVVNVIDGTHITNLQLKHDVKMKKKNELDELLVRELFEQLIRPLYNMTPITPKEISLINEKIFQYSTMKEWKLYMIGRLVEKQSEKLCILHFG
jgi:hypothetical protein